MDLQFSSLSHPQEVVEGFRLQCILFVSSKPFVVKSYNYNFERCIPTNVWCLDVLSAAAWNDGSSASSEDHYCLTDVQTKFVLHKELEYRKSVPLITVLLNLSIRPGSFSLFHKIANIHNCHM